jgi:hypothetical protein
MDLPTQSAKEDLPQVRIHLPRVSPTTGQDTPTTGQSYHRSGYTYYRSVLPQASIHIPTTVHTPATGE